jgi:hypothetical protein
MLSHGGDPKWRNFISAKNEMLWQVSPTASLRGAQRRGNPVRPLEKPRAYGPRNDEVGVIRPS